MNADRFIIHCLILAKLWEKLPFIWEKEASFALTKALDVLGIPLPNMEISVVLTNDHMVQELNKTFRHKDYPTNVLSFPSEEKNELGDIILAYETIEREAKEAGISVLHHTLHLIIHGFLHLLGYDHEKEEEAHRMERLEIQILKDLNIQNPYENL